jgi:hypothetical protein
MNIQIGDLVKLSGIVAHTYGVNFGTVIETTRLFPDPVGDRGSNQPDFPNDEVNVMMYNAGLGQFTQWIHISRLEKVTPVDRL